MDQKTSFTQSEIEEAFVNYVVEKFEVWKRPPPAGLDIKALALFSAIEVAFVSCHGEPLHINRWVTDGRLVQLLSSYGNLSVSGQLQGDDTIVKDMYQAFMFTIITAIRGGVLRQVDGKPHFRCFPIPSWLEIYANSWCDTEEFRQPQAGFWPKDEELVIAPGDTDGSIDPVH